MAKSRKGGRRWTGPKGIMAVRGDKTRVSIVKQGTPTVRETADLAVKEIPKLLHNPTAIKAALLLIEQFVRHPSRPGMRRIQVAEFEANKLIPLRLNPAEQQRTFAIQKGMIVARQQLAAAGAKLNGRRATEHPPG